MTSYIVPKTTEDVDHIHVGMEVTADLMFDDGNVSTITSETYEKPDGSIWLAGQCIVCPSGAPVGVNFMALHTPLPEPKPDPVEKDIEAAARVLYNVFNPKDNWDDTTPNPIVKASLTRYARALRDAGMLPHPRQEGYDPEANLVTISLDGFDTNKIAATWGNVLEDPWRDIPDSNIERVTAAWLTTRIANIIAKA